jgi:GTPase
VDAFAATLQEAVDADLLLHVVDASNPSHPEHIASVMGVLKDIGADQIPQIVVFNKLDAMDAATVPALLVDQMELDGQSVSRIYVSARNGLGLADLRGLLAQRVVAQAVEPTGMHPQDPRSLGGTPSTSS